LQFCAKFSRGGGEIVAGCNDGVLRIFDIERGVVSESVRAHGDDINSVCFAGGQGDAADIVISGSDERPTPLKVWDRRALGRPVGVLLGHRSGVTHVAPRGDGAHVLSVGKDQVLKIWDRRRAGATSADALRDSARVWLDFDYRWERTDFDRVWSPRDASLMTLAGPAVQQTLVRAHFSPLDATGGRFVYSGSADGCIYVFEVSPAASVRRARLHRCPTRLTRRCPSPPPLLAGAHGRARAAPAPPLRRDARRELAPDAAAAGLGVLGRRARALGLRRARGRRVPQRGAPLRRRRRARASPQPRRAPRRQSGSWRRRRRRRRRSRSRWRWRRRR
jgi:WD repeat-containing protein 23